MRLIPKKIKERMVTGKRYRFVNEQSVMAGFNDVVKRAGDTYSLDICSGLDGIKDHRFQTIDILPEFEDEKGNHFHPDFCGDILAAFAPTFCEDENFLDKNAQVLDIDESYWKAIRIQDGVEYIPWRFQSFLYKWLYDLLEDDGSLLVATPNLAYIFGVYAANRERQKQGKMPVYPMSEHIYCKEGVSWHMQQWVWFKLYSGGTPGDNHYCSYDSFSLGSVLYETGFRKIKIFDGHTLIAYARKIPLGKVRSDGDSLSMSIKSATGGGR